MNVFIKIALLFVGSAAYLPCQGAELGQGSNVNKTIGHIERIAPAINNIIPRDAVIEVLAEGHGWAEGPLWVPQLDALLYSDIPANAIYIHQDGVGAIPWLKPSPETPLGSNWSNGLALDSKGKLALAQHGSRQIVRLESKLSKPSSTFKSLAKNYEGLQFNSPNDLVFHSNGSVYFTDPPYGLAGGADDPAREMDIQGVFRLNPNGSVELLTDTLSRPNGIALSPNQDVLYVANSGEDQRVIMAYDLNADGSIASERVFFNSWGDGLKVDQQGNVFVAEPKLGVLVINPQGKLLGKILTTQLTSNVAFGDNGSALYITANSYLLRVKLDSKEGL